MKLRFPSGKVGFELKYYMGFEDPKGHLQERPQIVQDMYYRGKCRTGQFDDYTEEEIRQLIREVGNALDIKYDHIGSSWTNSQQARLAAFQTKLNGLLK